MNLCLETAGLWLVFVVFRAIFIHPSFQRWTFAFLVSMSLGLSAIAFYQFFDEMPQTRAQYRANPDAALRAAGLWFEPGSPERELFAQRLESVEPNGPFALTNSLAGILVPGLVIGVSLCFAGWPRRSRQSKTSELSRELVVTSVVRRSYRRQITVAISCGLSILPAIFALLLTKSRAGYLAFLTGVGLMAFIRFTGRRRWKYLAIGVGLVCLLIGIGVGVGGIDREIFSEAKKSLGYRLEYWESTTEMILDHPLTGVGPGNFQSIYTQYKRPWSSEEIADPHHFLMELGACYGIPILLLFITLSGILLIKTIRKIVSLRPPEASSERSATFASHTEAPLPSESPVATGGYALPRSVLVPEDSRPVEGVRTESFDGHIFMRRGYPRYFVVTLFVLALSWGLLTILGATAENPPQMRYFGIFALVVAFTTPLWLSMMSWPHRHDWCPVQTETNETTLPSADRRSQRPVAVPISDGFGITLLIPLIGVVSILVHLSASGGFGMPAVVTIFWALIALLLANHQKLSPITPLPSRHSQATRALASPPTSEELVASPPATSSPNRWQKPCFAIVSFVILVATVQLGLLPNLTRDTQLAAAQNPDCEISQVIKHCEVASQCDPRSERPWLRLAMAVHRSLCTEPANSPRRLELRRIWDHSVSQVLVLEPFAARNKRLFAAQSLELSQSPTYRDDPRQVIELQKLAIQLYSQAVELYPTLASLRAEYAQAFDFANDSASAKRQWAEALRLDKSTPHKDKKLTDEQRTIAEERTGYRDASDHRERISPTAR